MTSLLRTFCNACKETPRGFFAPAIALWTLFRDTADRVTTDRQQGLTQ